MSLSEHNKWVVASIYIPVVSILVTIILALWNGSGPNELASLNILKDHKPDHYIGLFVENISDENIEITSVSFEIENTKVSLESTNIYSMLFYWFGISTRDTSGTALLPGRTIGKSEGPIDLFVRYNYTAQKDKDMRCLIAWANVEIEFVGTQSNKTGVERYEGQKNLGRNECNIDHIKLEIEHYNNGK